MSGPDALFPIRNAFYLGAYQASINESASVDALSEAEVLERDCVVYRSYIALGSYQLVINEINDSAPTSLQAVKLLAKYLGEKERREETLSHLKEWLADPALASNPILQLVGGTVYVHEQDYNEALKYTHGGQTLELCALNVQIYLKMFRNDHAEKQLKSMQHIDEDHTLTQLANAWLNLALGGAKVQEAYYIFQDFCDKYVQTPLLLNGKAVACMQMGRFDEAEQALLEALNKDAKDSDTLANLVVCNLHLSKPTSRYLSQLKMSFPDHSLVKRASYAEAAFDRALQAIA
ncbi:hypothetical protein GOP47_0019013 [Adiantum capillus-veneris]|uniref:Coatomer subunit epsilon n=1 Tax=Adiantum capillus-veneris TaxID=13818 RepID=A0A9D4UFI7_ADICA|nr:hypothetical protein GOP47_0019013 [Adiantum capillus-veneris]